MSNNVAEEHRSKECYWSNILAQSAVLSGVVIRSFLDIAIITYGSNRKAKKEVASYYYYFCVILVN